MTVHWTEGAHHGLVWPRAIAVVASSVTIESASRLWDTVEADADLSRFLTLLSECSGSDVLSLPDFAIAIRSGSGWQLAARGTLEVRVDGQEPVRGAGVTTWAERHLDAGGSVVVGLATASGGVRRPLVAGLVPASALAWAPGDPVGPQSAGLPLNLPLPPAPEPTQPADEAVVEDASREDWAPPRELSVVPLAGEETRFDPDADEVRSGDAAAVDLPVDELPVDELPMKQVPVDDDADEVPPVAVSEQIVAAPEEHPDVPDDGAEAPGRFARQYGDTQLWSVEDAAVRPDTPSEGAPVDVPAGAGDQAGSLEGDGLGDHDGATLLMHAFRAGAPEGAQPSQDEPPAGPTVLAVVCPAGHPNPPQRPVCSECGVALDAAPAQVARPSLGRLVLPNGNRLELTAPVIVGRKPRADRVQGPVLPRLVPLSQGHVSSNHVEIRLEGWNVLAVDLNSTNGTFLRRHGEAPVRLGERPELLVQGDVLDLGHGVHVVVEFLR